ncbi:MAG: hypothetical protein QXF80_06865, partial [Thermoplasmatales archaeon]
TVNDIENLGLKIVKNYSYDYPYAELYKNKNNEYELKIPSYKGNYNFLVKDKSYDLSGSVIFKCLVVQGLGIEHVFLLGKEYTGQWWMHSLPPGYWNRSIASCERWLLEMRRGDILVSES